jgi:hypothetical protein
LAVPGAEVVAGGVVRVGGLERSGISVHAFANPTVQALDRAGAVGIRLLPLGASQTDARGRFAMTGDLDSLPAAYRGSRGEVDITVMASDAARSVSTNYTLFPASAVDGTLPRALPATSNNLRLVRAADSPAMPLAHVDLARGTAWTSANDPAGWIDSAGKALGASGRDRAVRTLVTAPTGLVAYARQYSWYAALSDFDRASHVNDSYCRQRFASSYWETGTARNTTRSAGVSFPGIGLSAQSGYGSSVDMRFNFSVSGYICGNSSLGPDSSSLVSAKR